MTTIDLHIHSNHSSDGEFSPEALVAMAADAGLQIMAIADHNLTTAVGPAMAAGRGRGVEVVPAVELDCVFDATPLHLLGYFINHDHPRYQEVWSNLEKQEIAASARRIALVQGLGVRLDAEAALAASHGGIVTGELLAELAMADPRNRNLSLLAPYFPGGARSDNPFVNFYWDYCSIGKPAHVDITYMSFAEAVALIRETGGVPVLAHPGMVLRDKEDMLPRLVDAGLRGLEAYSSYHAPEACRFWREFGERLGLVITCGSDFHGKIKPAVRLGDHGGNVDGREVLKALGELV